MLVSRHDLCNGDISDVPSPQAPRFVRAPVLIEVDNLRRWAERACLDEFESFVGLEYVLSKLEIGAIVPSFETWTDEGDRNVICFIFPDEDGRRLRTSVADSGL